MDVSCLCFQRLTSEKYSSQLDNACRVTSTWIFSLSPGWMYLRFADAFHRLSESTLTLNLFEMAERESPVRTV